MSAYLNLIAGQWQASGTGRTFENRNPADTDDLVGTFPESSADDVAGAVEAARNAQPGWAAMPAPKRGDVLYRAANLLEARADAP